VRQQIQALKTDVEAGGEIAVTVVTIVRRRDGHQLVDAVLILEGRDKAIVNKTGTNTAAQEERHDWFVWGVVC
jgi:hypothetical protein